MMDFGNTPPSGFDMCMMCSFIRLLPTWETHVKASILPPCSSWNKSSHLLTTLWESVTNRSPCRKIETQLHSSWSIGVLKQTPPCPPLYPFSATIHMRPMKLSFWLCASELLSCRIQSQGVSCPSMHSAIPFYQVRSSMHLKHFELDLWEKLDEKTQLLYKYSPLHLHFESPLGNSLLLERGRVLVWVLCTCAIWDCLRNPWELLRSESPAGIDVSSWISSKTPHFVVCKSSAQCRSSFRLVCWFMGATNIYIARPKEPFQHAT